MKEAFYKLIFKKNLSFQIIYKWLIWRQLDEEWGGSCKDSEKNSKQLRRKKIKTKLITGLEENG